MANEEDIRQQLSAYIDGELDAGEAAAVEQALARNAELARELDQLKATRELLRRLPVEHAPEDFAARVLARTERRSLVHPHAPARQGVNWLRYSLTAAVALIAVSVALVTVVGIYKAQNPGRVVVAVHPPANEPGGEAVALMDKPGKAAPGENENLKSAAEGADKNVEESLAADSNITICTDNLDKARKELESGLGKNSIPYQSHWAGDEEAVVVADVDRSQVSRLDKVISDLRSDNLGAELSGKQLKEARCREQPMAGGDEKNADAAAKEGRKPNEFAKKDYYKQGGGASGGGKLAENEPAGATPGAGAGLDADGGKVAKNAPPPGSPAKPAGPIAEGAAAPTTRPASDNAAPVLADKGQFERPAQKAPCPDDTTTSPGRPAQIAMATSQGNFNVLRNQFALRVQITLQYHPALTQSLGAAQNQNGGPAGQNFNQTSQSRPADEAASRPDNSQQNLNR